MTQGDQFLNRKYVVMASSAAIIRISGTEYGV